MHWRKNNLITLEMLSTINHLSPAITIFRFVRAFLYKWANGITNECNTQDVNKTNKNQRDDMFMPLFMMMMITMMMYVKIISKAQTSDKYLFWL